MYTKSGTQNVPPVCCHIPWYLPTHLLTCKSPARSPIDHAALACTNPKASRVAYIHTSPPRVDPPSPLKRLPLSPATIKSTPSIIDPQCTSAKRGRPSPANVTERSGPRSAGPPRHPIPLPFQTPLPLHLDCTRYGEENQPQSITPLHSPIASRDSDR